MQLDELLYNTINIEFKKEIHPRSQSAYYFWMEENFGEEEYLGQGERLECERRVGYEYR